MKGRVGHVSQVRASRSGLAGHAVPTGTYIGTLPYLRYFYYMYILGRRTGDDDSLIYWKYIIISYSREARISNRGWLKKRKNQNQNLGTRSM